MTTTHTAPADDRCSTCHRDAHRPGMANFGTHGHAYTAPAQPATAGLFDALTGEELGNLADALIHRDGWRTRFTANLMANMFGQMTGADATAKYHDYRDIAREIGSLHGQLVDRYIALMDGTASNV